MKDEPDIFISNGTCYSAAGQQADDAMIPCGNDIYGPLTCCQQGDMCLSSRACYNGEFGVTYLSGCSDPEYLDESCPDKGRDEDEPWVGLSYCNGTSEEWFACVQSDSPDTLALPDPCWCPDEPRVIAFSASSVLDDRVRLGSSLGESVIWMPGHVPTRPPSDAADDDDNTEETSPISPTSSTSSSISSTSSIAPTDTPSSSLTFSPSSTSNTTANETSPPGDSESDSGVDRSPSKEIWIGVGIGAGIIVMLLVLGIFRWWRWRHKRHRRVGNEAEKADGGSANARTPAPATPGVSELDTCAARPWSMRTELPDAPRSVAAEMESPASPAQSPFQEQHPSASPTRALGPAREKRLPPLPALELPG